MNKRQRAAQKPIDTQNPPNTPAPPLSPFVKRNEVGDERDGGNDRAEQAHKSEKPLHWTSYAEAFCAISLVLITGAYTFYASKQSVASIDAANAAKSAAETAHTALIVSEKAYVVTGAPVLDLKKLFVQIPLINSGHVPSGEVKVRVIEATVVNEIPASKDYEKTTWHSKESHFKEASLGPIIQSSAVPGSASHINLDTPSLDVAQLASGHEGVLVSGEISYNNGFPGTPNDKWAFCSQTYFNITTKENTFTPCSSGTYAALAVTKRKYNIPDMK